MKISVIIVVYNEEAFIKDCLESVRFADEILLLDGGSTDQTLAIAKKFPVKISQQKGHDFASWRNQALDETKNDWILYLDADERITPESSEEIKKILAKEKIDFAVYAFPRRNFLLGRELHHGGWYPDYVERLFYRKNLKRWQGILHERPQYEGSLGYLKEPMIHFQPETLEPALEKSIKWSGVEADLLRRAGHPRISWWRVLRMGATTLFDRLVKKQGFRDGVEGWIESFYQSFHTMIVYLRLWESQ